VVIVTPGQDTALTIRNTLLGGRAAGVARCVPPVAAEQSRQPQDRRLLHQPPAAYSFAVARAGDLLRRTRIRRSLDALTGTVLLAFGIRLAADR
jgi:threonine/homoserine/homoserine lactone efflux protein